MDKIISFEFASGIKKSVVLLFITLYATQGFAHDTLVGKRVYLGFGFFSSHSRIFYPGGTYNHPGSNYSSYFKAGPGASEKEFFPYKYGLDFKIRITNRIALSTGFFVDVMGTAFTEPRSLVTGPSGGLIGIYSQLDFSSKYTYFEIPLRFDFRFTGKPLSPFLTFGAYSGIRYKATFGDERYLNGGAIERTTTTTFYDVNAPLLSQMYSNFQLGLGLDAHAKKFKFQLFPFYDFGFMGNTATAGVNYRHRIGGAISVTHSL